MNTGLRWLKRGSEKPEVVTYRKIDTFVDQLEEFAAAVRGQGAPEVDGEKATLSLAVMRAGIRSAQIGRRVDIAEILADPHG